MTIVNLAQNFVGSNNVNILQPLGQFGTRINGGKDAASPRYIFTMLRSAPQDALDMPLPVMMQRTLFRELSWQRLHSMKLLESPPYDVTCLSCRCSLGNAWMVGLVGHFNSRVLH